MDRNIRLYPWLKFSQHLVFWQGVWFLYFQSELSAAQAIALYALYELFTTVLEVPSGYASDRLGRRPTLILCTALGVGAAALQIGGGSFAIFAVAQLLLGASQAFNSGTDSAMLYESLAAEGRAAEIEAQELKAFRFGFAALAISALTGGAMALIDFAWVYVATALSFAVGFGISLLLKEPPHTKTEATLARDIGALRTAFRRPVLIWIFALFLLAHVFSNLPFVFGQPFILEALDVLGVAGQTPLVSGAIVSAMMVLSILASLAAPSLRARFDLGILLIAAFALQIIIPAAMALSDATIVILILIARMVPQAFIGPYITARIQPELTDGVRATFVSIKSLAGRLILSGTLAFSALFVGETSQLAMADIQMVLGWYTLAGLAALAVLIATLKWARV
ncbi:MAG: MFS transporter [Pseudomonadota bacterium]